MSACAPGRCPPHPSWPSGIFHSLDLYALQLTHILCWNTAIKSGQCITKLLPKPLLKWVNIWIAFFKVKWNNCPLQHKANLNDKVLVLVPGQSLLWQICIASFVNSNFSSCLHLDQTSFCFYRAVSFNVKFISEFTLDFKVPTTLTVSTYRILSFLLNTYYVVPF